MRLLVIALVISAAGCASANQTSGAASPAVRPAGSTASGGCTGRDVVVVKNFKWTSLDIYANRSFLGTVGEGTTTLALGPTETGSGVHFAARSNNRPVRDGDGVTMTRRCER